MLPHSSAHFPGAVPVQLTDLAVRHATPPAKGYVTLWDGTLKGFGCMVGHGGTRSFCVLVASGRRKVIGKYPLMGVSEARKLAREMLAEKTLRKTLPRRHAFEDAKEGYLADVALRNAPRTHKDYTRLLNRHYPFGRKNLADIQPREIIKQLANLPPIEKRYAHAVGKAFFKWATRQHIIDRSPMENLQPPKIGKPRERVLNDDELKAIYRTALKGQTPFHKIVVLLILTGQRRGEIAQLQWDWIKDDGIIEIPYAYTKNKKTHRFPYGDQTKAVIEGISHTVGSPFVFPAHRERTKGTPATTFNGWSKAKAAFDKECKVTGWVLHDCRRVVSTKMAQLGISQITVEKLLNHISGGTQSQIAQVYNRHTYLAEMREAVTLWENHLEALCARP